MKKRAVITAMLTLAASAAWAQEAPNSHTLNEQLQNVQAGKPAVPLTAHGTTSSGKTTVGGTETVSTSSGLSHKASPLNPTPATSATTTEIAPTSKDKFGQPIESLGSGAIPALPLQEMISGQIHFITGGVGDEEVDQLKSVESQYNFHLLLTAGTGEYVSGCMLRLRDANNVDVLATGGAGPYFYAKLNPGEYTLDITTAQGMTQTVPLKVLPNALLNKTVQFNN